ncbi:unnamed protein product [Aphanomyces euteiches]
MSSLLSGIRFGATARSDSDSDDDIKKKKKKKKESKKKDSKSSHKSKEKDGNEEDKTTPVAAAKPPLQREDWMQMDFVTEPKQAKLTAEQQRQQDEDKKRQEEIDQGLREPNSGLLYGLYDPKKPTAATSATSSSQSTASIGDGGASWKRKMLERAKQRAASTGDSLEDIVREQYGMSVAELEAQARGAADSDAHLRYKRHASPPRSSASSRGGDKHLISQYQSRMKFTELSKHSDEKRGGNDNDHGNDDDGGPIDYSKLPDTDDSQPHRHHHRRRRSADRHGDSRRNRSRDRPRRSRSRERRRSPPRKQKEPVPVREATEEEKDEAARRAAFLYRKPPSLEVSSLPRESPSPSSPPPLRKSEPVALTDEPLDLNKLAARALRAKMRGNMELFKTLTNQLNQLEHVQEETKQKATHPKATVRPRESLPHRAEDNLQGAKRGKRKQPGDDGQTLDDLVREEKSKQGLDMDAVTARNIVRLGTRYEGSDLGQKKGASGFDEEEDVNMKMHLSDKARLTEKAYAAKSDRAMLGDRMQWDKTMQRCWYCPSSDSFKQHLVVAMGEYSFLALQSASTVVEFQCLIAPMEHVHAMTAVDEAVDAEIARFKAALEAMAQSQKQSVLFVEHTHDASKRRHSFITCVPVAREVAADAPLYFKQAMMECDEEWSTHKKIIDTTGKGIKRAIPPNFAYFHVEWDGGRAGYGHIIEDSNQFPADFGLDTIAGMLEVDPPRYGRYQPSLAAENDRVRRFSAAWKPFDWTTSSQEPQQNDA